MWPFRRSGFSPFSGIWTLNSTAWIWTWFVDYFFQAVNHWENCKVQIFLSTLLTSIFFECIKRIWFLIDSLFGNYKINVKNQNNHVLLFSFVFFISCLIPCLNHFFLYGDKNAHTISSSSAFIKFCQWRK